MLYGICTSEGRFRPLFGVKRRQNLQRRKLAIHKFPIFQGHLWWARQGLNLRPHPCEGCALPLSYAPAPSERAASIAAASQPGKGRSASSSTRRCATARPSSG